MVVIGKPKIEKSPKITYMGIRFIAPFKGMSKDIRKSADELNAWVDENKVKTIGPPFLRYHVIDMRGFMDLSFCVPVNKVLTNDGNVKSGELPPGKYASL